MGQHEIAASPTLTDNTVNRVYLITYVQADLTKFPTRQSLEAACVAAFGGNKVQYFCCSKEEHQEGGIHYHVTILLASSTRWASSKSYLIDNYGVGVNFSTSPNGSMYAGAYHFATIRTTIMGQSWVSQ